MNSFSQSAYLKFQVYSPRHGRSTILSQWSWIEIERVTFDSALFSISNAGYRSLTKKCEFVIQESNLSYYR